MTLPLDTIAAVAGIVTGVTCLSWLAYEFAPAIIEYLSERVRPESPCDETWREADYGDFPSVSTLFHSSTVTERGQQDHV